MNLIEQYKITDLQEKEILEIEKRLKWSFDEKCQYLCDGLIGAINVLLELQWFTHYHKIIDLLIKYDIKGELLYVLYNDISKRNSHLFGQQLEWMIIKTNLTEDDYVFDETTNKLTLIRERKKEIECLIREIEIAIERRND